MGSSRPKYAAVVPQRLQRLRLPFQEDCLGSTRRRIHHLTAKLVAMHREERNRTQEVVGQLLSMCQTLQSRIHKACVPPVRI